MFLIYSKFSFLLFFLVYFIIVNLNLFSINMLFILPSEHYTWQSFLIEFHTFPIQACPCLTELKLSFILLRIRNKCVLYFLCVSWTKLISGQDFLLSHYHFTSLLISHNAFLYTSWHFLLIPVGTWFGNICSCHKDGWCILF